LPNADCDLGGKNKLLITHCDPDVSRINRQNALKRNELICELCDGLLVPWLDPDGSTHEIVEKVCGHKSVAVFDPDYNSDLVNSGAQTAEEFLAK
jgi:predicted Rossmann fold nucleotide-binding protein DprA/Smf involved in DNA uptake